jgi:large-conductance mechanosensitive channel
MEKTINDFSFGLFLWQIFGLLFLVAILYFTIKLYKKITKYLDKNS